MNLRNLTLALLLAVGLSASAANEKTTVSQVTDGVSLTTDVDYIITGTTPFTTAGSVDIKNTENAVLVFESVRPAAVKSKWMDNIYINGEKAVNGTNCWVEIYKNGAIVYPHPETNYRPLTVYPEAGFEGEAYNAFIPYTKHTTGKWVNNIKSFKLKRGYMATIATNSNGQGWSKVFIAQDHDVEIDFAKVNYGKYISMKAGFIRVFPWRNITKKGTAGAPGLQTQLTVTWRYGWDGGGWHDDEVEYIPQHHHEGWPSWSGINSLNACNTVLGNNEPDNQSDSREQYIKPEEIEERMFGAKGSWQNEAYSGGLRIGSPAMSGDCRGTWLSTFMDLCTKYNCRIDFIADHCYWFNNGGNYYWQMDQTYNKYKRPIWITEWNYGANWTNWVREDKSASDENQTSEKNAVEDIVNNLESHPHVERYAFYNWVQDCRTIVYDGQLTKAGKWYAALKSKESYTDANEYTMGWNYWAPSDLTATLTSTRVALAWTHLNGKQTNNVIIEYKEVMGDNKWTELKDLGMMEKSSPSYTYKEIPDLDIKGKTGVIYFRIANHDSDGKTRYSNETSVSVGSSLGTSDFQYGKISITKLDAINTEFSESFSEMPAVFMGTITNKNSALYPGNLVTGVSKTKFSYQVLPWSKQSTTSSNLTLTEEISFMALKAGNYKFGSLDAEVAVVQVKGDEKEIVFNTPFPEGVTPVVLTEIRNPSLKVNPLSVSVWDVTNKGFKCKVQYEEAIGQKINLNMNVCYFAITPGFDAVDKENDILIAAGFSNNPVYGASVKDCNFMNGEDSLYFRSPYVFGRTQTMNYPTGHILRKGTEMYVSDASDEKYKLVYGCRFKRLVDLTATTDVKNAAASADQVGYVVLANSADFASIPTAINGVTVADGADTDITINNGIISVAGNKAYDVFNVAGEKVNASSALPSGIYVVKIGNKATKVMVK